MKRVLVTGGSGFIGTNLVDYLLKKGFEVISLDIVYPKVDAHKRFFKFIDILDQANLISLISEYKPKCIFHLAARTDLNEKTNINGYSVNIQGTGNLIEAIKISKAVKRCIFASTQLVCRIGSIPKNDLDYSPNTLYGESKVRMEKIIKKNDGGGIQWCIIRPTTVWGPGMSPHYQGFLMMVKKGVYFHVGSRPLYKSYGFTGNFVYQLVKLLESPVERFHRQTFYLADYEPLSLRAWINAFQREFGGRPVKTCPEVLANTLAKIGDLLGLMGAQNIPFNSFRLNNILTEYRFNLAKTEELCGPLPYTMEEGVKLTASWFLDQLKEVV